MSDSELVESANISGDPFKDSEYFALAEASMERHWGHFIEPIIGNGPLGTVIDLAIGHGRNTEKLRHIASKVIGVDINQECIDHCKDRFKDANNVELVKTDGTEFTGVADGSADLVYCFDAMVHFQPEIVEAYIPEFARVLKTGGKGFIHHSNWTNALGGNFQEQPHWRNFMSKDLFGYMLHKAGLKIVSQTVTGWDASIPDAANLPGFVANLDCISYFEKV